MTWIEKDIKDILSIYISDVWSVEDVWYDLVESHPWLEEVDDTTHTIKVEEDGSWIVQHPLSERLKGTLFSCDFYEDFREQPAGTYKR